MWRTGRVLAGLAIALFLLLAPSATAAAAWADQAAPVVAQQPTPNPPPQDEDSLTERQRMAIGTTGVVLIGLVLVSRKIRKLPVFFVKRKK
ncbi:hypothetical protein GCM10011581_13350 [Saccharopolyspora subtropica]|uniref:MYXO-CTERM domain-containing protein n=1 Tax=Saccharopolyspora thermophila TaxID=89367 RepID=A0A917JQG9_9PSEU|nr:hypothetical protein [Saccharopolyspora subtropica]GGI77579.1 hypothetical protein GCM10011581_13350 [Saccharopolyspora subtropica]